MDAFDLDTPALYVDLDVLERNIRGMQERARGWGVALRPHAKTHKIEAIARMQLAAGAVGLTFAKLSEAEAMPGDDVLLAYPVMPDKAERLRRLAERRRVTVAVDSFDAARAAGDVRTLVEVDVGFGRCGVQSPEEALRVARACRRPAGVLYFPGALDEAGFDAARARLEEVLGAFAAEGLPVDVVSGGSTPGARHTGRIPRTTEIRPGTYVFNDAETVDLGCAAEADCALRVLTTVVSTAVPGRAVVDAGSKTLSSDARPGGRGHGLFRGRPWTLERLNEEHGMARIEGPAKVGEKVWLIPAHVCPTVNLHDEVAYGRSGRVEGRWRVSARGRTR